MFLDSSCKSFFWAKIIYKSCYKAVSILFKPIIYKASKWIAEWFSQSIIAKPEISKPYFIWPVLPDQK
jgi:hypothetical protein